jgi:hypothetical protein
MPTGDLADQADDLSPPGHLAGPVAGTQRLLEPGWVAGRPIKSPARLIGHPDDASPDS